jgi:hypothetical protein
MRAQTELLGRKHPMVAEKTARPANDDISPYLQQPLRTLEAAQKDCKRRQREAADARGRTKRPD